MTKKLDRWISQNSPKRINTANIIQRLRRYRIELHHIAQDIEGALARLESGEQAKPPS